jgi:hypothetical protein
MSDVAWDVLPCLCHSSTIHNPASAQPRQLVQERSVGVPATAGTMHVVADCSIFRQKLTSPGKLGDSLHLNEAPVDVC